MKYIKFRHTNAFTIGNPFQTGLRFLNIAKLCAFINAPDKEAQRFQIGMPA